VVVPAGWVTDLEVLRLSGSVIERRAGFTVIRSPRIPGFHWGNFVLVRDRDLALAVDRCLEVFAEEFPDADHTAIGLPAEPDPAPWRARGVDVESELVLSMPVPCPPRPLPAGYEVHRLHADSDWAGAVAADLADARASGRPPQEGFAAYLAALWGVRADLSRRGQAAFFGAFAGSGELVTRLGIVLCSPEAGHAPVARYQHVGTRVEHRGRGLASHLLGRAAEWAAGHGADRWEIHVDPGTAAHRLYAGLGFGPTGRTWQVYRAPGHQD
jgi:GNAT superfamily N-acetyltransferase